MNPTDPFVGFLGSPAELPTPEPGSYRSTWAFSDPRAPTLEDLDIGNGTTTIRRILHTALRRAAFDASDANRALIRDELRRTTCNLYITFLANSRNRDVFARRFGWILRRVTLSYVSALAQAHNSPALSGLVTTASFNSLLEYAYRHLGNFPLARDVIQHMLERGIAFSKETFEIVSLGGRDLSNTRKEDEAVLAALASLLERARQGAGLIMPHGALQAPVDTSAPALQEPPTFGNPIGPCVAVPLFGDQRPLVNLCYRPSENPDQKITTRFTSPLLHPEAIADAMRRLIANGMWTEAHDMMHAVLQAGVETDQATGQTSYAFRPVWATKFLQILMDDTRHFLRKSRREARLQEKSPRVDSPYPSPFRLVDDVVALHSRWCIRRTTALFLACLKQANATPHQFLRNQLLKWIEEGDLDPATFGSRTAVRMLHSIKHHLQDVADTSSQLPPQQERRLQACRDLLDWWHLDEPYGGARMLARGPIDGKMIRGIYCFWSCQDVTQITVLMRQIRKLMGRLGLPKELRATLTLDKIQWGPNLIIETRQGQAGPLHLIYAWDSERTFATDVHVEVQW